MSYDYATSKSRVDEILLSKTEIIKVRMSENDSEFTYSNGIKP